MGLKYKFLILTGVLILSASAFSGCVTTAKDQKTSFENTLTPENKIDKVYVSPDLKKSTPLKVAVLPFENLSKNADASPIVRKVFYNNFSSKKYEDVELYKVDTVLRKNNLYEKHKFLKSSPEKLGNLFRADGLIYGKITHFESVFLGVYSSITVEIEVKLVKTETGKVLWKAKHKINHREGSVPFTPLELIPAVVRASFNLRQIEFLRASDDLCRTVVSSLPGPGIGMVMNPPRITFFANDSKGRWKKTGDTIHVAMVGDSGKTATFDLADIRQGLSMGEEKPGVYSGYYQVRPGDMLKNGIVTGYLMDERGNKSEWIDPLNPVNIDTKPPAAPKKPVALSRNQSAVLKWSGSKDVFEYKVYRSKSPKSGYLEITKTQLKRFYDKNLKNGTTYYYKIAALDRAENQSSFSDYVSCIPVKPGPTPVSGNIEVDTIWHTASSPLIIMDEVVVTNGATLTIEPGAIIKSEGAGIIIRGRLLAQGNKDNIIQIENSKTKNDHPFWNGIVFDNTNDADSRLEYCKIRQADNAVTIIASSPVLIHNTIMGNGTGILISELSRPVIRDNTIMDNHKQGIVCESRCAPDISVNTITGNQQGGMLCTNAVPVIIHNNFSGNKNYELKYVNEYPGVLSTSENWWGTGDIIRISSKIEGLIRYATILNGPYPEGKPVNILSDILNSAENEKDISGGKISDKTILLLIPDLIKKAVKKMGEEKNKEALIILQKIIAAQPDNPKAHFILGMLFGRMGNADKALKHMEIAARLDPGNSDYHYNLGLAYSERQDISKAVGEWKKTLELDPDNNKAQTLLDMYPDHN